MSASPAARVRVRDLAKAYGAVEALRGVTFEVGAGEIYGLLGRNGAGKTTTLECVLGLRHPNAGSISIEGIDAVAEPHRIKALVGAQLQGATLQDKLTPREAIGLFGSFYGQVAPTEELLERFALGDKADEAFATLSGGQRQRLFLALAFINRPHVLLLDEPTAGLDPQARRELHRAIAELAAIGVAVLLSTHDLDEARQLCTRVGILHDGRIIADAPPGELAAKSRASPRLEFRTVHLLETAAVSDLAQRAHFERCPNGWSIETAAINPTIAALMKHLEDTGNALVDLQVVRPSLEDVFIELTGQAWAETEDGP